ncbi:unnamed protein product [Schistosoma guineensis]|nr:unnamed protein product [Schistosoma guineensis]
MLPWDLNIINVYNNIFSYTLYTTTTNNNNNSNNDNNNNNNNDNNNNNNNNNNNHSYCNTSQVVNVLWLCINLLQTMFT